jgi:hypothetical protein
LGRNIWFQEGEERMRTVRQKRNMWIVEELGKVIGIYNNEKEANKCAGIEVDEPKITGAIVEESILEADANDDGIITKEEVENWLKDED